MKIVYFQLNRMQHVNENEPNELKRTTTTTNQMNGIDSDEIE